MAIRNIVKDTDEYNMLHKKCRPVTDFNQKLWDLLDDMAETMYKAEASALAGPQVGHAQKGVCHRRRRRDSGIYQS